MFRHLSTIKNYIRQKWPPTHTDKRCNSKRLPQRPLAQDAQRPCIFKNTQVCLSYGCCITDALAKRKKKPLIAPQQHAEQFYTPTAITRFCIPVVFPLKRDGKVSLWCTATTVSAPGQSAFSPLGITSQTFQQSEKLKTKEEMQVQMKHLVQNHSC